MRDATADDDVIVLDRDHIEAIDMRYIDHGFDRAVQPASRFDQQVGTTAHDTRPPIVATQYFQRLDHRRRCVIVLPTIYRCRRHLAY
jgi:hypothetical protein